MNLELARSITLLNEAQIFSGSYTNVHYNLGHAVDEIIQW